MSTINIDVKHPQTVVVKGRDNETTLLASQIIGVAHGPKKIMVYLRSGSELEFGMASAGTSKEAYTTLLTVVGVTD